MSDLFHLQFTRTGVIHVIAASVAEGENMIAESTETATSPVNAEAKATKKASAGARRAPSAPVKAKAGKKASPTKKAPKSEKKGESARDGSKTAKILDLLKRPDGATTRELLKTTGWQAHSLRGFLSGTLGKKMGLTVTSAKGKDGERTYSVKP